MGIHCSKELEKDIGGQGKSFVSYLSSYESPWKLETASMEQDQEVILSRDLMAVFKLIGR